MNRRNKLCKLIFFLTMAVLSTAIVGCATKYTTVADDITAVDGEEEYITIEELNLNPKPDSGREDIGYCAILIPDGFYQSEDIPGMYVNKLYPMDSSNIYYTVSDAVTVGVVDDSLTLEDYEKAVEKGFSQEGKNIDLVVDEFSKDEMEGIPCYKIRSHYSIGDENLQQLVYIILGSDTHVITYTQMSDDELMADFKTAEGQIKLVRERSQA